ncbi:hypothetical protein BCR42DRAFT_100001 [Absidia repens]|uniref:Uncharacterized protein n=1 Tax=Absidia repens TaxID=90262 RepID=A0A1X2I857_9FUNG|nr:hypothetical protein BCR42DRAFT_100001 [Absidia repens]
MKKIILILVVLGTVLFTSAFGQRRRGKGIICAPCGGRAAEHNNKCCGNGIVKPNGICECKCTGDGGCPSFYVCLGGFCGIPVPGVNCGECGFTPQQGRCCGRGIYNSGSGTCFCSTSGGRQCLENFDCVGKGRGTQYCCGGVCKQGRC